MNSMYRVCSIHDTQTLVPHREHIRKLFLSCFGKSFDPALWAWAYCDNPCGPAYVHLAYAGEELVAHYAMIPLRYIGAGCRVVAALSMTTMVHPSHRKSGLFRDLAEATYQQGSADGVSAVVGFPNSNSIPGFRKRLNWKINEQLGIASLPVTSQTTSNIPTVESISAADFRTAFRSPTKAMTLDLSDPAILEWRLGKPGARYQLLRAPDTLFIVKPFGNTLDVVYHSRLDARDIEMLSDYASRHGFLALTVFKKIGEQSSQMTPYRFGFRIFRSKKLEFEPQLILSDVF